MECKNTFNDGILLSRYCVPVLRELKVKEQVKQAWSFDEFLRPHITMKTFSLCPLMLSLKFDPRLLTVFSVFRNRKF